MNISSSRIANRSSRAVFSMSSIDILDMKSLYNPDYDYIEVDNVRIFPSCIYFKAAYDGKKFEEKFRIINYGKYPAIARIFPTTSQSFKMKPLPKGVMLASGMSVVRTISYTYSASDSISQVFFCIYINNQSIMYPLEVQISQPSVSVSPRLLNFGETDIGTSSKELSIFLKNKSSVRAKFSIDLGRNDLEIIVSPMTGRIEPGKTQEVKMEILGCKEGTFCREIWIKTEPLQRFWVTGKFIIPRLEIEYPLAHHFDLIVIDYPRTYYNAQNSRIFIIKNVSSTDSMFCTVAECKGKEDMKLDEARVIDNNLKFFQIAPKEGRLLKNHNAVITVTFAPNKIKLFTKKYCIVFIKVVKINYRDGFVGARKHNEDPKTFTTTAAADTFQIDEQVIEDVVWDFASSHLRICLYGEIEEVDVTLTPTEIERNCLHMGEECRLTFNIKNGSKYLPVTFSYEKVAGFEMDPREYTLKPASSLDVLLILKPYSLGNFVNKISLGLYYKNRDGVVYKVGDAFLRVSYIVRSAGDYRSSTRVFPKRFSCGFIRGMVATENARCSADVGEVPLANFDSKTAMKEYFNKENRNSLSISKKKDVIQDAKTSKSICFELPRYKTIDKNAVKQLEKSFKKKDDQNYIEYLRRKSSKSISYEGGTPSSQLFMKEKFVDCPPAFSIQEKHPEFIPLTPEELMDVKIIPRYVILGTIAPYVHCSEFFQIKNNNKFPIRISIVDFSHCIIVKGNMRQKIEGNSTKKVYFDCFSEGFGKFYVPVHIMINDFHICDTVVFAEVVPTTVKCKLKEILINKDHTGYLELYNPVNCAVDFAWDVQDKNYQIIPKEGKIEPRKNLYIEITFSLLIESIFKTEVFLLSQSGAKQIIKVSNDQLKTSIKFNPMPVELKNIPLNIEVTKAFVIRNDSENVTVLRVINPNPIEQITVSPTECFIEGKCDMWFTVTVLFKTIMSFKCSVDFLTLDGRQGTVQISGNVIFPNVIMEPETIYIPKLVTGAYQRRVFRVINSCSAKSKIKFLKCPYVYLTDLDGNKITDEIVLSPKEYIELFMEFKPNEPTSYTLYMPYIINDLVGPPLLNNPDSFNIGKYLDPPDSAISKKIPTLKITCSASGPWFEFSNLMLKFNEEKSEEHFSLKNISAVRRDIHFDLTNLGACFEVNTVSCTGLFVQKDKFIKVYLQNQQTVQLKFTFSPGQYGTYNGTIPFFVKTFYSRCPFNYIKLCGSKLRPVIETKHKIIKMPPIPFEETYTKKITLTLLNHKEACEIRAKDHHRYLSTELMKNEANITFCPKKECTVVSKVVLTCTCDSSCTCTIMVRSQCHNCFLLSFRHKMSWWCEDTNSVYTEGPQEPQKQAFAKRIEKLNSIMERYVFTQCFFAFNYYKIPTTISKYNFFLYSNDCLNPVKCIDTKKNLYDFHLPIIGLLKNLVNSNILHYVNDGKLLGSVEDREGTTYDYSTYKNVLKFLEDYGVFVKNLSPELLLCYDRYVVFKTQFVDDENLSSDEILSEKKFTCLSRQCWLDFLIKIFKLLHYDRLLEDHPPVTGKLEVEDVYGPEFEEYYKTEIKTLPDILDRCDAKLMLWIEYHFNTQKDILWPNAKFPERKIRDLSKDLRDSLPLATLLTAYCPYLSAMFKDIYFQDSVSCYHHNACLICDAWAKLQLSYKITTSSILEPVNIEMFFLLAYLYLILPNFFPLQSLSVKSHLGKTTYVKILLRNTANVSVCYACVLFVDNASFELTSEKVALAPRAEKEVLVSYTAKQIIREDAVLVLCGEPSGQRYSKTMALNLIGIPDILVCTQEFMFKADIYTTENRVLEVISPYGKAYHATTNFYILRQGEPTLNDFVSLTNLPNLPRQIELDGVCAFDEKGVHQLNLTMCFVMLGKWIYYVYFIDNEVGIFSIQITFSVGNKETIARPIYVKIKSDFDVNAVCRCDTRGLNASCPKVLCVNIPFQNEFLINGLRNMIKIYATKNEIDFWNTHLVFPKGFHIFRSYLENTYNDIVVPFKKVLHAKVTYTPKPLSRRFVVKQKFNIDDVTIEGFHRLLIHWNSTQYPQQETLLLSAHHGFEARYYLLIFSDDKDHSTFFERDDRLQ